MSKIHPDIPQKFKKFIAEQFDEKAVVLCQFCGGVSCPQQDFQTNKKQPNAIHGLHSNWITADILAMQRPSDRIIKEYNIYEQFKKNKLNTILNLQQPGEHPYCGDGLLSKVGFSYNPQGFFTHGILFFNESWEDMTATTFEQMMRIMNIFHLSIIQNKGKISVHCHAGRGRTLLVICSWLIYNDRFTAKQTIDLAVQKRQGVLTRSTQRQFLYEFEQQLKVRWKTFSPLFKNFSEFVQKQNVSLLKGQQKIADQRPYIHSHILIELRKRLDKQKGLQLVEAMIGKSAQWTAQKQQRLTQIKGKINNHQYYNEDVSIIQSLEAKTLIQLFYDFYDELPFVIIGAYALQFILSEDVGKKQEKLSALLNPEIIHEIQVQGLAVTLDLVHFLKQLVNSCLKIKNQSDEDYHKCQCLFVRIAILLCSKTKYHPKIFTGMRNCKLLNYKPNKHLKYTNASVTNFANFLRNLTTEIPKQIDDINTIILKIRKIDANLYYYKLNHQNFEGGFYKEEDARAIYENSKI